MVAPDSQRNAPWLAVVTVSFGSQDVLGGFLASVGAASTTPLAVVVSDNLPEPDNEVQHLTERIGASYLPMGSNVGYGSAMNAAIESLPASVEWILISNPDVVLSPGAIDKMVSVGETDPHIGSIGPGILNLDGTLYPSARAVPSLRTGVGHAMFFNLWPSNPWSRRYLNDTAIPTMRRDAGWLSGSCFLVRRSAFDELGGFDPEYFMYFEDVDLGYRLGKHEYRNVYEPSIHVTHAGAHSTTADSDKMIAAHHKSARRFLARKYPGPLLWPIRASLNVGLAIRSALVARRVKNQGN